MFEDHSLIHDLLQSLLESSRDIAVRKSLWHSISAIASNNLNLVVREIIKTISVCCFYISLLFLDQKDIE